MSKLKNIDHIFFFLYNISITTRDNGIIIIIAYTAYTKVNGDINLNDYQIHFVCFLHCCMDFDRPRYQIAQMNSYFPHFQF